MIRGGWGVANIYHEWVVAPVGVRFTSGNLLLALLGDVCFYGRHVSLI